MNLFFLDLLPALCALYHCDKHVVKMILEAGQVLACAHHLTNSKASPLPWNMLRQHKRYPCVAWTCESIENYRYLVTLGLALCAEYTHRYKKVHAKQASIEWLRDNEPSLPNIPMTTLTPAVPDECLVPNDTIQSYRNYYIYIKRYFAKWSKRDAPQWFVDGVENMSDKDKEWSEKKIQSVKEGKKAKSERIKKSKQDKEAKEKQKDKPKPEKKKKAEKEPVEKTSKYFKASKKSKV